MTIARVLVVDDDADIRYIAKMSLARIGGFEVTAATSGAEALTSLANDVPDVVLLDVMMPGMNGEETIRQIKVQEAFAALPVIFMTAKVQDWELQDYLALGAAGVISKPFDPVKLPELVREIVEETAR